MSIIQHQVTHAAFDAALSLAESALCAESGLSIAQVQTRLGLLTPLLAQYVHFMDRSDESGLTRSQQARFQAIAAEIFQLVRPVPRLVTATLLADAKAVPLLLHFPPAEGSRQQVMVAVPAAPVVLLTTELSALLAEQPPRMYSFDRQEMVRLGS